MGNSLWLPVLLAVICVAGVLAGIWLRVALFEKRRNDVLRLVDELRRWD
jgi:hypothetical protein